MGKYVVVNPLNGFADLTVSELQSPAIFFYFFFLTTYVHLANELPFSSERKQC